MFQQVIVNPKHELKTQEFLLSGSLFIDLPGCTEMTGAVEPHTYVYEVLFFNKIYLYIHSRLFSIRMMKSDGFFRVIFYIVILFYAEWLFLMFREKGGNVQ